jgi:hypothetical protein
MIKLLNLVSKNNDNHLDLNVKLIFLTKIINIFIKLIFIYYWYYNYLLGLFSKLAHWLVSINIT